MGGKKVKKEQQVGKAGREMRIKKGNA